MEKKDKIFNLKINNSTHKGLTKFLDKPEVKEKIFDNLYETIESSYNKRSTKANLCEINGSGIFVTLSKSQWINALSSSLIHFSEEEQYEKCNKINKLMDQLYEERRKQNPIKEGIREFVASKYLS
jgi:uncharacterized protein YlxW (UPF0749 family)|tara:strand:- start:952 stop:1329 length:378 start_codon:yes stop_codon:yes gene_type:complete